MQRPPPIRHNGYDRANPSTIKVVLACTAEWVDEQEVEITGVSEDIQGRDWLEFTCPRCGRSHGSFRYD